MIKDSFLLSFATIFTIGLGIIGQHFLSNYLSITEYGKLQYILSWIAILNFFSLSNFNTIVIKATTQGYSQFFRKCNQIRFLASFGGTISLLAIGYFYKSEYAFLFYVAAFFFPVYAGLKSVDSYLTGKKAFKQYTFLKTFSQVLIISGTTLTIIYYPKADFALIPMLLLSSLIYGGFTLYYHQKEKGKKKNIEKEKELIKYGFQLSLINIISPLASKLQFIILEANSGSTFLAIYAVAQLFPDRIKSVFKDGLKPVKIYLSAAPKEVGIQFLKKSILLFILLGFLLFVGVLIFLPFFIMLIFGNDYVESINFALLISISIITAPYIFLFNGFILYHSYKKIYTKIVITKAIAKIVLYLILIPFFQIYGIIITILIIELFSLIGYVFWVFKVLKVESNHQIITFDPITKNTNKLLLANLSGNNIISVIGCDEIMGKGIPLWAKIIGKVSFTKFS